MNKNKSKHLLKLFIRACKKCDINVKKRKYRVIVCKNRHQNEEGIVHKSMPSRRGGESLLRKAASAEGNKPERQVEPEDDAIVHFSVVDIAADRVRGGIENGMFLPNAKISELALSREMGISRTTMRKALLRLEEQGIVLHVPGYGMVVLGASANAQEQMDSRFNALCFTAAYLAKGKIPAQGQERVLALHNALCALWAARHQTVPDADEVLLDRKLHMHVAEAGGNASLKENIMRMLCLREKNPEMLCGSEVDMHRKVHEDMLNILEIGQATTDEDAQKP